MTKPTLASYLSTIKGLVTTLACAAFGFYQIRISGDLTRVQLALEFVLFLGSTIYVTAVAVEIWSRRQS